MRSSSSEATAGPMENADRPLNSELAEWLRYYRDLGITHLYRRDALGSEGEHHQSPFDPTADSAIATPAHPMTRNPMKTDSHPGSAARSAKATDPQRREQQKPETELFTAARPQESLEQIRTDLGDCRRCKLAGGRKTIVFGSGNPKAELVFVGEGPGADEDEQGLPFVGRAGQLLTDMIEKGLKIPRPDVYICNIVKCRPPGNRKPEKDEVAVCREFVERQIDAIRPRVICALGSTAAETLLDTRESMGRLRGKWYEFHGYPLMVTYHPAFLLRD